MKNVNILGTEYSIEIDDTLEKTELDGLCKEYNKQISVRSVGSMLNDNDSTDTKKIRFEEVLRHEIIHAFFMKQALKIIAIMNSLLIGLQSNFLSLKRHLKKLIAYEYKYSDEPLLQGS